MSEVVKIEDFNVGRMRIARTTWQNDDVQDYIDEQEKFYLKRLLGLELYNLLIADLDASGVPQSARFLSIYNEFELDNDCDGCDSRGMKIMLKGLIFFHVVRDQPVKQNTTGIARKKRENSENVGINSFDFVTRYNNSVDDFMCISKKICSDLETYPEYNGKELEYIINL